MPPSQGENRGCESRAGYQFVNIVEQYTELNNSYDLTDESVVVDVGGYTGDWSRKILARHNPKVLHLFAPVPWFMTWCRFRLIKHPQVVFHQCAIDEKDGERSIRVDRDATSMFYRPHETVSAPTTSIKTISVPTFLAMLPKTVHLLALNAEGAEFHILEYLIATGEVRRFRDILVQFHSFVPGSKDREEAIHKALRKTHTLTYEWQTVWENWRLNS